MTINLKMVENPNFEFLKFIFMFIRTQGSIFKKETLLFPYFQLNFIKIIITDLVTGT